MNYLLTDEKTFLYREIYQEEGRHRIRNIAIFEVALYCALRPSEITIMELGSYDPKTHNIYCRRLKGSNSNTLRIVDPHVVKALDDWMVERATINCNCSALFVSQKGNPLSRQRLDAIMKHYCEKARYIHPNKHHMHILKHTRAIDLAEHEVDIDDIQFWLGHKNVANTFKYLEFTPVLKKQLFNKLSVLEGGEYKSRY